MRAIPVCVIFMLAFPNVGRAWSAAGHEIIASIAFRQLTREEQVWVVTILKQHPRFDEGFSSLMPDEVTAAAEEVQDEWIFQ